ncbi:RPG, partial [Trifolium medium]|nr:RPG [Trifolium medium]
NDANSCGEEMSVGYDDVDSISNASDTTFSRTSVSSQCDQLENIFYPGELGSKRRGPLTTCSDHDVGSLDSSFPSWIENFPQQSNVDEWKTNVQERQDSTCSKDDSYSVYDTSTLKNASSTSTTLSLGTEIQDKMED